MLKPTINQQQQYQQQAGASKPILYQGNGTMMTASLSQWQQHFSTSCHPTSYGLWNAFFLENNNPPVATGPASQVMAKASRQSGLNRVLQPFVAVLSLSNGCGVD